MEEKLLQYVWKYKLFGASNVKTVAGEDIAILSVGVENSDSGPDFVNAKVRINEIMWAGCVEVHVKSSDWNKHRHKENKAYANVILQVVYEYDETSLSMDGSVIPTLALQPLIPPTLLETYNNYMCSTKQIVCQHQFATMNAVHLFRWLEQVAVERLEMRVKQIEQLLESKREDKRGVFYYYLASSFGFKTNTLPFSLLAESLPLSALAKHKNSLFQLEAMFFGQADLLPNTPSDDYIESLQKEYKFLQQKFSLERICTASMWKFAKLYPAGFPTVRIAQFAALIYSSSSLLSKTLATKQVEDLITLFSVKASAYWDSHYRFGILSPKSTEKLLGNTAISSLIINAILPFMFAYSTWQHDTKLRNKVIAFYKSLPFEDNTVTRQYSVLRPDFTHAFHSQALIHLYNNYCLPKQCLHCNVGVHLLSP